MAETQGAVLITGAAGGIGRLLAARFARRGRDLVLWDIDADGLDQAKQEFESSGVRIHADPCDLTDRHAIAAAAQRVSDAGHEVDLLINNAGIVSGKPLLEISDENIERTFAVNALAPFWTTRAFLPGMIERGHGHIVTIASAAGIAGTSRLTDYCASKFAAVGFDDSLRLELRRLGQPIRTTVVCPYYVHTGMFEGVKTRFPLLLPIMQPDRVADRIVKAIEKKQQRLILPWFLYAVYLCRILPVSWSDAIMDALGVTHTMDDFQGRT